MKITATIQFFNGLLGKDRVVDLNDSATYRDKTSEIDIETNDLKPGELEKLLAGMNKLETPDQRMLRRIEGLLKFQKNPEGEPVVRLERLEMALRKFIGQSPHKYLFQIEEDGFTVPYFVTHIEFHPAETARGGKRPAYVIVEYSSITHERKEETSVSFHSHHLHGKKTVKQVLQDKGFFLETPEVYESWQKDIALYDELHGKTGRQFHAKGIAFGGRWGGKIELERDGMPARVIMDYFGDGDSTGSDGEALPGATASTSKIEDSMADASFWDSKDSETHGESTTSAPVHPYVQVFDFSQHDHVLVHVRNLEAYKYRTDLMDKLVLPDEVRELVTILIQSADALMDDIIAGKTGGTVVASTGLPGTGKTLTAEVASEALRRPLYPVQCSQLGVHPNDLEKRLMLVLHRASRWGALLLLDEADVYVRARGDDIHQNAIVGVFLRVLEYYRGILFMTSNRETLIDDAIMSRCMAHIRYELPKPDSLLRIWKILSDNYGVELSPQALKKLVEQHEGISGRNVKNLLKLAIPVAKTRKCKVTPELIAEVSKFIKLATP
jgi:hypothetical protein